MITQKTYETLHTNERGFFALISVLIISSMLLGMTLSLGEAGIMRRFAVLLFEHKHTSEKRAETCVSYAQILVFNDPTFTITTPTQFEIRTRDTCTIVALTINDKLRTVKAQGISGEAYTNLLVEIDRASGHIVSFEEVVRF
jgi:hypothetical protein